MSGAWLSRQAAPLPRRRARILPFFSSQEANRKKAAEMAEMPEDQFQKERARLARLSRTFRSAKARQNLSDVIEEAERLREEKTHAVET